MEVCPFVIILGTDYCDISRVQGVVDFVYDVCHTESHKCQLMCNTMYILLFQL